MTHPISTEGCLWMINEWTDYFCSKWQSNIHKITPISRCLVESKSLLENKKIKKKLHARIMYHVKRQNLFLFKRCSSLIYSYLTISTLLSKSRNVFTKSGVELIWIISLLILSAWRQRPRKESKVQNMSLSLFWFLTWRGLVVGYRRFMTTYRPSVQE